MNQLYHPRHTGEFFTMLAQNPAIPVFTVTNNVVGDLATFADAEKKQKTLVGVEQFLEANRFCKVDTLCDRALAELDLACDQICCVL